MKNQVRTYKNCNLDKFPINGGKWPVKEFRSSNLRKGKKNVKNQLIPNHPC